MPRRPGTEASRQRILDATARCFRDRGYAATTLGEIAARAGMQAGSLYYHFESKEQLLEQVLDIGVRRVFDAVRDAVEPLPAAAHRQRFEAATAAHLTMLLAHGDYTSANIRIFGQVPAAVRARHLPLRRAYADYWRGLFRSARAAGALRDDCDLGVIQMLLLGALNWSVEWFDPHMKPISKVAAEVCRLVFDGVGRSPRED